MEFTIDGDIDGEVVGSSAEMEGSRAGDDNETGGSSVEGAFQLGQDDKLILDSSGRNLIPSAIPVVSVVSADEPYVGQEFETEAAAHAFYNAYATHVGFIIRVSKLSRSRRDGTAIGRALVCNKEGYRMPDKREKIVRQRAETRVGCRAMILVRKVSSGKWVVTKFVKEHTHPLTPGKGRRDCIYDQYPNEHDKIRELSQQLAIEKKRAATYKRHLDLIFEHIEEHNESLSKKIQHIVDSVKEIEGKEQQVDSDVGVRAVETSSRQEPIAYQEEAILEPYQGMEFESEDAAKIFYDDYARRLGFVMRVMSCRRSERDGRILARRLGCNKEGHCVSIRGKFGPNRKPRASTREGCKAMIHVKYDKSGKWVITKFVKEHNHSLVVSPREARQTMDEKDKKIQELSAELRNKKRLCTTYQEQLTAFMKIVEEYNDQLSLKVRNVVNNLKEFEFIDVELTQRG
ncbi:hypothetical protein ACLB2K_035347 [Fragaria x ananassa]